MTVKRRLFLSNLLMIAIPVLIAALVGIGCIAVVFHMVESGTYYGMDDEEEFFIGTRAAAELAEGALKDGQTLTDEGTAALKKLLDASSSRMEIYSGNKKIFDYGNKEEDDDKLIEAISILDEKGTVATAGGRVIYRTVEQVGGRDYNIFVMVTQSKGMSNDLKTVIVAAGATILFLVLLTILITNKILTKHVFRRIAEPLDILTDGAGEIGNGNLDYQITYDRNDEFKPACEAFNDMAVRLKTSVERTRQNEEGRKELMAGISHDIRSPLTSIKAYVEGLLDGIAKTQEDRNKYLITIKRKAEDIDRMVEQMLTFSKIEMDEFPMEMTKFRLDQEIKKFISDVQGEYERKALMIAAEDFAPCSVKADKQQLRRAIRNILDNSAKYKEKELANVSISLEKYDGTCKLTLTDDGPGVSEEAQGKLFDVFYRTDPARRNPAGGSGLGLAITAKSIQRMGGSIKAEKGETGGLGIIITLPSVEV